MQDILMEINNLSYRYEDGTLALDQVSLQIRRHERLAIMGSNGSGKSTLFLNLNGVLQPSDGEILLDGVPVKRDRKGLTELRRRVGIVFQDPDDQLFSADVYRVLYSSPGKLFSREEIYTKIWGTEVVVGDRTIDVHIRKLRQKIGDERIVTIKGVGYKFEVSEG